jgi:hypothetical protein
MRPDEADHAAYVGDWLDRAAPNPEDLPPDQLVSLFERATEALWRRAQVTLGEVTLAAIVDRVLYTASERYSLLSTLKIEKTGVCFDRFREQETAQRDGDLVRALCFILVEFLTAVGNLTDEILTQALYAALARVTLEEPASTAAEDRGDKGADRDKKRQDLTHRNGRPQPR